MDTDSGAFIMEMQAKKIADNIMSYNGSQPCPQCGVIMNPTQVMYSKGMCSDCFAQHSAKRLKDRMA
jgi:hypothetical protein